MDVPLVPLGAWIEKAATDVLGIFLVVD